MYNSFNGCLQRTTILKEALEIVNLEKCGQDERTALDEGPHDDTAGGGLVGYGLGSELG